jgi:hypothetical protein
MLGFVNFFIGTLPRFKAALLSAVYRLPSRACGYGDRFITQFSPLALYLVVESLVYSRSVGSS